MTCRLLMAAAGVAALAAFGLLLSDIGSRANAQGYGDALINVQEKARRLKCQNNLQQIRAALGEYRGRMGRFPSDLGALVEKKFIDRRLLRCPSSNTPADAIDYQVAPSASGGEVLCRCRQAWHQGGRNVLRADGTVEWLRDS